ncbi:MAG: hypothetical protein R2942_06675 [Ignavibacteria bacterium]
MMLREEGLEVKSYLGLYKSSNSKQTKDIAAACKGFGGAFG